MRTIGIVVVSDTRDAETDRSGPAVLGALADMEWQTLEITYTKDDVPAIQKAIKSIAGKCDLVFTTGGTGFSPRDVTPEATGPLLDRRADGLCELMRLKGLVHTPFSHLSRGVAGMMGKTLIVNLPGAPKGAHQGVEAIKHLLEPIMSTLNDEGCSAEC